MNRFWIGLLVSLFGGLLGIGFFREWVKLNFVFLNDPTLDLISFIILIIGLLISTLEHLNQSKDIKNIKKEQNGRTINSKEKEKLISDLKVCPKVKIELTTIQGDRESRIFADIIKDILIESNWEVDGVYEDIILGGVGYGLVIRESSSELDSIGNILFNIMNKNNIHARLIVKPSIKPDSIEIIVGSRPQN